MSRYLTTNKVNRFMKEAIKLAIEKGGYSELPTGGLPYPGLASIITCDPLFWQALGKALGWGTLTGTGVYVEEGHQLLEEGEETWKYYAHQYFDLLLTGGDTEQWWKELLTKPN